jgi:hypothetical protein
MKNNTLLLVLGLALVGYGVLKPDLGSLITPSVPVINNVVNVEKPLDPDLLSWCDDVIKSFRQTRDRKADALKLSSLYYDLANLISLDSNNEVIKNTLEIREANKLAGILFNLNIKGKYPDLAQACNNLVVIGIGDDDVILDENMRKKAVETFKALSWACYEGSK